jgi:hypothetical protein
MATVLVSSAVGLIAKGQLRGDPADGNRAIGNEDAGAYLHCGSVVLVA